MERATTAGARTDLGAALGTTSLAVVHYRLAPGEGFPSGLHAHDDQAETFVILDGEAVFETLPPASDWPTDGPPSDDSSTKGTEPQDGDAPSGREVTVAASEAVRFAPGEFQTGRNPADADRDLVALALGAPKETSDVRIPAGCPRTDCGARTLRLGASGDAFTFDCPDCGACTEPAPCPGCGSDDLAMALDDAYQPVARCADCEREFEQPPIVD